MEVAVLLGGSAAIALDDFLQLQKGDVLTLRRQKGEPLEVLVENTPVFLAQPGLKGKHLAVQLTGWIEEEGMAGEVKKTFSERGGPETLLKDNDQDQKMQVVLDFP